MKFSAIASLALVLAPPFQTATAQTAARATTSALKKPWKIELFNDPVLRGADGKPFDEGNPWWYADPEIHRFGGKFWIYATRSAPYKRQLNLDCFSSDDLINWTKHEAIINEPSIPDAWRSCWAPTVAHKDGHYYLLVGTNDLSLGASASEYSTGDIGGMYLLRSEKPQGPFTQFMGKNVPLIGDNYFGAQAIDACMFLDDDNTMYLVYGGWTTCLMAKFKDDMTGFVPLGEENWKKHNNPDRNANEYNRFMDYFVHLTNYGSRGADDNLQLGELNYNMKFLGRNEYLEEGPIIYKLDGYYYLMYSVGGWTGDTYGLRYAIAKKPMGPYTTIPGRFLQTRYSANARGAGHHSMVYIEENDTWMNSYHRRPIGGGVHDRYTALDVAHMYDGEINFVAYDPSLPVGKRVFVEESPTRARLFEPAIPTFYWSSDNPLPKNLAGYAQNVNKIGVKPQYGASGQSAGTAQAGHAFDAGINTASYWQSNDAGPGHWLRVDFGEAAAYNEIHVYFNQLGPDTGSIAPNARIQIQSSGNGTNWTDLVFANSAANSAANSIVGRTLSEAERTRRDGSYYFVREALATAHTSRFVRLYFQGAQTVGVHEFEVYNITSANQLAALQNAGAKIEEVNPGAIPASNIVRIMLMSAPMPSATRVNMQTNTTTTVAPVRRAAATALSDSLNDAPVLSLTGGADAPITSMAVVPGSGMRGSTDPYIVYDNGYYYYARAENETSVTVSRASRLEDIGKAGKVTAWAPDFIRFPLLRSPRLHKIGGKWYLYVSASNGDGHRPGLNLPTNLWNDDYHFNIYVLEADGPLGPFEMKGMITKPGKWATDGTVLRHPGNGKDYFIWSGRMDDEPEGHGNPAEPVQAPSAANPQGGMPSSIPGKPRQALYIAEMANPWTLAGDRALISQPDLYWEQGTLANSVAVAVNESPAAAIRGDDIYIFYSANHGTHINSSIGMLKASAESDPTKAASWAKATRPVFRGGDSVAIDNAAGVFYVRQPCLVKSPDGTEDWLLYQAGARSYGSAAGDPANPTQMRQYLNSMKNRSVRMQKIAWDGNGYPSFAVATTRSAALAGNAAMADQTFPRPSGTGNSGVYIIEAEDAVLTGVINPGDRTTADTDFVGLRAKTGIVGQWQRGGNEETAGPQDNARGGWGTYWNASGGLAVRLGKDGAAKFEVNVSKTGTYTLSVIGVALEYNAAQIVDINGVKYEIAHTLYSQRYGGLFTPQSLTVVLEEGNNVITISNKENSLGAVIDYIYIGSLGVMYEQF